MIDTKVGMDTRDQPRNDQLARRYAGTRERIAGLEKLEQQLKDACAISHAQNRSKTDHDHIYGIPQPKGTFHDDNEDAWINIPRSSLGQIESIFYLTEDRPRLAAMLRDALEAVEDEDVALETRRRKYFLVFIRVIHYIILMFSFPC